MGSIAFVLSFLGFFVVVFAFIIVLRLINYRETIALAEKGLLRPEGAGRDGKDTLRWGIIFSAVGLALCVGLWPVSALFPTYAFPLGLGPWMLVGLVPLFFGLGLVLIYVLTRPEEKDEKKPENKDQNPPL
jgi:hypothetical protein